MEEACEELRTAHGRDAPDLAWLKLKDAKSLRSRKRAVAQGVAAWREREAAATDVPVRQVLPDLAVLGIAQRQPTNLDELGQARGIDERHRRGRTGRELLETVAKADRGSSRRPQRRRPASTGACGRLSRSCRRGSARSPAMPASTRRCSPLRADLVAVLRDDPDAKLAHGWRAELLGDGITRLLDGRSALTFDGKGSLRLVDV